MKIVVDFVDGHIPRYVISGKWANYSFENDILLISSDSSTDTPPEAAAIPMSKVLMVREFNEEG